ncbi:gliding motility protein [Streptomyces sp. NPDC093546]|uniref:gliding motility protein n=1 Tax=Streptomyces sp. NPDC093546 TaxID=3366040 RepID=UPI0038149D02
MTADTDTAAQTAAESEAAAEVTEAAETTGAAPAPEAAGGEGVEIPKQQSAEEAADNGAGEGARK